MSTRPAILQSRLIRIFCPLKGGSRRYATSTSTTSSSTTSQPWPHQFGNIHDDQVAKLAARPQHPLALADLVRHGRPPLSAEALFSSANFTLSLLPIRLAHRIQALRNLPFIVVSNPHIARIYSNYVHSLSTLLPWQERRITNLEDEIQFTHVMADLVQTHSNTIPILARGFLECRKYISPADVTRFLDEHLRARIGTRLIAEQHIALHLSSQPHTQPPTATSKNTSPFASTSQPQPPSYIGVIDTSLHPSAVIRHCESFVADLCELKYGVRPSLLIHEPSRSTTLAHVPTHLEYILTELLKNAFRATVESGNERLPVEITLAAAPDSPVDADPHTLAGFGDGGDHGEGGLTIPGVTIRIRDRGGGIPPETLPHIWAYSFTTFSDEDVSEADAGLNAITNSSAGGPDASSLAGLGYGLPLGRAYAEHFGGGIQVQSLWGWGTDVYLKLRGLGGVR